MWQIPRCSSYRGHKAPLHRPFQCKGSGRCVSPGPAGAYLRNLLLRARLIRDDGPSFRRSIAWHQPRGTFSRRGHGFVRTMVLTSYFHWRSSIIRPSGSLISPRYESPKSTGSRAMSIPLPSDNLLPLPYPPPQAQYPDILFPRVFLISAWDHLQK